MNSDLKITLSRVLEKPLQINGTDTETHYINELFKRLVFHELLNKLNLKTYTTIETMLNIVLVR